MFRPGDQIGPYTLVDKLGKGAFGVVWLAERRTQITTTKAAIKIPLDEDISIETIKNEADVWVRASGHPNVLPIIEADIYGEHIIIASEYAPDGSLDAWLRKHGKAPTVELAVEIVSGILSGLEHLHSRNIIHRDLKPANILFQGSTPRLADFGISRVLKSTSQSSNIMGTPSYMAPEAFDGKRNEQTDIWSVGVIFYQLLSGRLPFEQADITSLLGAILTHNPETLPVTVPKPLQNVIARALAKDPGLRYKSAAEMRAALRNPLETDPNYDPEKSIVTVVSPSVNTSPPQYFHPPTEKKSNTPHFVYAIAGLLAVVILVGSVMWLNSNAKGISSVNSDNRSISTPSPNPNKSSETKTENDTGKVINTPTPAAANTSGQEEALLLIKECTTPYSAPLGAWKFKIRTDGNGIKIKFPGVDHWVDHPAEGSVPAPDGIETGDVQFVSSNKKSQTSRFGCIKNFPSPNRNGGGYVQGARVALGFSNGVTDSVYTDSDGEAVIEHRTTGNATVYVNGQDKGSMNTPSRKLVFI